jgi:hypothetical protein
VTPLQTVQSLLSIGFAVAALIICADTRRSLIRAEAAATRAETALREIKALREQDRSAP